MTTGRELVMTSSVTISPCVKVSGGDLPAVTRPAARLGQPERAKGLQSNVSQPSNDALRNA